MYKYYHYPSGKEIFANRKLNKLELDKYFQLEESYLDFEEYWQAKFPDQEIKFCRKKFREWLEEQPISFILQVEEIEVTKVKVID